MMVELRDYQLECVDTIYKHFKKDNKQLIQIPTGGGKTWIFLEYLRRYSRKAVIVCPSKELAEQIGYWANRFLGDRRVYTKKRNRLNKADAYIITAASFNYEKSLTLLEDLDFDTLVIDEAHHAQADTYLNLLDRIKDKKFNLLGLTATPERLDQKSLLDVFGTMTFKRNIIEMIKEGYLCELEGTRIKTNIKLSSNWIRYGDYIPSALSALDIDSRNNIIMKTFFDNCVGKKTLVFCLNVTHAERIAELLRQEGIKAECIHAKMNFPLRKAILERFKRGETQVVTNVQVLTEGFDEPSIEALLITRPTLSKSLYCQMIGRGLRLYPGKDKCSVYDITDNAHKICTFNVVAGYELENMFESQPRTKITELQEPEIKLSVTDFTIEKEKLQFFNIENHVNDDGINIFKSPFNKMSQSECQLIKISRPELTRLEAMFLIWKEKLKVKYGFNK